MPHAALKPVVRTAARVVEPLSPLLRPLHLDPKSLAELSYWWKAHRREGELDNAHYEALFTDDIGIDREAYRDKRILDIGCGPRGSLEWADHARERVGLDPLADSYRRFGIEHHQMDYVCTGSESIPFPDNHFDIVTSINSLDHVDDVDRTVAEICRVVAPGGRVIVLVDIRDKRTVAEPHTFGWTLPSKFVGLDVLRNENYEVDLEDLGARSAVRRGVRYDHEDPRSRNGVLLAELSKPAA